MESVVTYKKNEEIREILFDAADFETIKKAVNQWRVRNNVDIIDIEDPK